MKKLALLLIVLIFSSVCYAQCVAKGRMVAEVIDNKSSVSFVKQGTLTSLNNTILLTTNPNTSVSYSVESTDECSSNKNFISKVLTTDSKGQIMIKTKKIKRVVFNND